MGLSIIDTYVGVYIKVNSERFRETLESIGFYDNEYEKTPNLLCHDRFMNPCGGLKKMSILLPYDCDYSFQNGCCDIKMTEEAKEIDFSEIHKYKQNFIKDFSFEISELKKLYGEENVIVKTGIVNYKDEIG
jgi:hypothetical protein